MKSFIYKFALYSLATLAGTLAAGRLIAADPRTLEDGWTYQVYEGKSSAASSTHTIVGVSVATSPGHAGVGFSWQVYAKGADVKFKIHSTTRTYAGWEAFAQGSPGELSDPRQTVVISTISSSEMTAFDGKPRGGTFKALTLDPYITIDGMNTAATVYVTIDFGQKKER